MSQQAASGELAARAGSALVLGTLAIAALWFGGWLFSLLVATLAGVMSWEWGRAVRAATVDVGHFVHVFGVVIACMTIAFASPLIAALSLAAATVVLLAIYRNMDGAVSGLGVFYAGVPAVTLIWLRQEQAYGFYAVLYIFCVVWAHDTCAMLVGKTFGGPRLWPDLSPKKTWSGVAGGLLASAAVGALFATLLPNANTLLFVVSGTLLGLAGLTGDLLESAFKRFYGLKNASGLIPGHGGVLDRLDGVVVAALAALVIAFLVDPHTPATSFLFWE